MKRFTGIFLACAVLGSAAQAAPTPTSKPVVPAYLPLEPGKKSEEIKVAGPAAWSYYVYLPTGYAADRKWPVLFILSPVGGNGTDAAKRDADRLSAKYKGTGLADLFAKMGEPSAKP